MPTIRPPAVAGAFYPLDRAALERQVRRLIDEGRPPDPSGSPPAALIAPHAGYRYSGPVAGSTFAALGRLGAGVERVVLIGPSHHIAFRGIAQSGAEAFATPLGEVPIDREAERRLRRLPQVVVAPAVHAPEHALEVELPFLQRQLAGFSLVPLVVGAATAEEVADALELVWGDDASSLLVVSSDLSHYHDHDTAARLDRATSNRIGRLLDVSGDQACGFVAINGLLEALRRRSLPAPTVIDLRNSGDTAGPRGNVVGYGAFVA